MISYHIDVDNLWSYEEEFGVPRSNQYELMYTQALPEFLRIFKDHGVKATFFVIGKDAEQFESCREFCKHAVEQGHEIANHTYSHRSDFHRLSYAEKEEEIRRCDEILSKVTGQKIRGFRCPGYYLDSDIFEILSKLGYLYDTSVLPGPFNFLMKLFIRLNGSKDLDKAFGRRRYVFSSQKISRVTVGNQTTASLLEFPVTSAPFLRFPIHSTIIYMLGKTYFRIVSFLMNSFKGNYIYLFHGIDALDYSGSQSFKGNLPAFRFSFEQRVQLIREILERFKSQECVTTQVLSENLFGSTLPGAPLLSYGLRPSRSNPGKAGILEH